jgi:putative ABC transport system permease protein
MRTLGASRIILSFIVFLEGIILTLIGSLIGIAAGHFALYLVTYFQESSQAKLSASIFIIEELFILTAGLGIGIIASLIPAFQAYRSDISKILSKN